MTMKYINADRLKAEIERLLKCTEQHRGEAVADGSRQTLYWIKDFINSLQQEQPEDVDMEKVFEKEYAKFSNDPDAMDYAFPIDLADYKDFARHFYELGLRAKMAFKQKQTEVDLEKEIETARNDDRYLVLNEERLIEEIAYFFELGKEKKEDSPEIGLDKFAKKIKTFQGRYEHPEIVSIKGAMAFMARMFYQYPNTAREWYNNLPKATMD